MSSASYLFCAALSRSSSDECSSWAVKERKTERRIRTDHNNRLWGSDDIYFPVRPSLGTNVESAWPGGPVGVCRACSCQLRGEEGAAVGWDVNHAGGVFSGRRRSARCKV